MQGAGKISQRRICLICKQEIFPATPQLGFMPFSGMKSGFLEVPIHSLDRRTVPFEYLIAFDFKGGGK